VQLPSKCLKPRAHTVLFYASAILEMCGFEYAWTSVGYPAQWNKEIRKLLPMKFYRDSPMMGPSFSFIYIFGDQVINSPFLMVKCQFDISIRILVG